jgi:DmsE family decaheme c-type cytochrome
MPRGAHLLLGLLAVSLAALLGAGLASAAEENGIVGDPACLECHEALHEGFTQAYAKTIHSKVLNEHNALAPFMRDGCEACHGPGGAHVEQGGGKGVGGLRTFANNDPAEIAEDNRVCLTCHEGGKQMHWRGSQHASRDIGCTSCHTLMTQKSPRNLMSASTEMNTCGSCHLAQRARQFRNSHMPVREGKMECSSCHNPHGTIADSLISSTTINDNCYSCHADKRGPFLWEHAPVNENCLNCHDAHGSARQSMLKSNVPRLCQECHLAGHAASPRTPQDRFVVGSGCLQCHPNVHGSNHPSGSRFTR